MAATLVRDAAGAVGLVRYDAMCRAIAEAHDVDEVKQIRDRAIALEHYSRLAHNIEAETQCCRIRLRAERRAGELLAKSEKAKGGQPFQATGRTVRPVEAPETLADQGISKTESSDWQKLAKVPEAQFEAALAGPEKPTTKGIIRTAAPVEITPVSDEALWLWGRLRDFGRLGLLAAEPAEILATMTPTMIADVRALLPRVIGWLERCAKEHDNGNVTTSAGRARHQIARVGQHDHRAPAIAAEDQPNHRGK